MNLKKIDNDQLIFQLKNLVQNERDILTKILKYLREVQDRRLYAHMGRSSLFEFCTKELKYSPAAAQRRISAMRLVQEYPEVENKINSGSLSLSKASQLSSFFKNEDKVRKESVSLSKKSPKDLRPNTTPSPRPQTLSNTQVKDTASPLSKNQKSKIIQQVESLSTLDCERHLASLSSAEVKPKESQRSIGSYTSIRFMADKKLMDKLIKLKSMLGSHLSMAELIDLMAEMTLEKRDPQRRHHRREKRAMSKVKTTQVRPSIDAIQKNQSDQESQGNDARELPVPETETTGELRNKIRAVPQRIKDHVFVRDQGQCTYRDPNTRRRCGCKDNLQYDHIIPFARGGDNSVVNIKVLCREHNLLKAVQDYGADKMNSYLRRKVSRRVHDRL